MFVGSRKAWCQARTAWVRKLTFDFLGFTHICGKTRAGKFLLYLCRLTSIAWPALQAHGLPDTSPRNAITGGAPEISRFSRKEVPCMHGVFDRAGPHRASRSRFGACCLPLRLTASAP